jgi:hypothetical protein
MKFLKIKYTNFRCFNDVEITFDTTKDKNISLIIAPNGGGKTEMLFSFWWVLYGFDFSTLKGKQDTPYSLNSSKYLELKSTNEKQEYTATVELFFEYDNVKYRLIRKEQFVKNYKNINIKQYVELSHYNENGSLSLRTTDPEDVKKIISRIIPDKILNGIIFDGERMQELNNDDDKSKAAIEGIIQDITNESLFEQCKIEFDELYKENSKEEKKVSKKIGNNSLEEILDQIMDAEDELANTKILHDTTKSNIDLLKKEIDNISKELKKHEQSKDAHSKREKISEQLQVESKKYLEYNDEFCKSLIEADVLIGEKLLCEVEKSLEEYDVPAGLTVEAVQSILKRDKCICGNEINDEVIATLNKLIVTLPPDNINSLINEMVRQSRMYVPNVTDKLKLHYDKIVESESKIEELKKDYNFYSSQITDGSPAKIVSLEEQYNEKKRELEDEKDNLEDYIGNLDYLKNRIDGLKKEKDNYSNQDKELTILSMKSSFLNNCIEVIEEIKEYNKKLALANINSKIDSAYKLISEDYSRGKRLYIVQFDNENKYRLVSYYIKNYESKKVQFESDGTIKYYKSINLTDEEIKEKIILNVLESNSTGQGKVNTLAFAKAILDYSNESRDSDSIEITKEYPFLIDSPFTELSGNNKLLPAQNIHTFTNQIILMISDDSLRDVRNELMPFVGNCVKLSKLKDLSCSVVEEVK